VAERDWSRHLATFERLLQPRIEVRQARRGMEVGVEHAR
jgi:hypothetical protein